MVNKENSVMFKRYMTEGTLDPEVQAVFKASEDIANGVMSLQDAAKFYRVSSEAIVQFIAESSEYDFVFNRERK
tara:strand:- start:4912 stop:5133 length:222 start_codon:yes stop_codon:yes gene_type:complete